MNRDLSCTEQTSPVCAPGTPFQQSRQCFAIAWLSNTQTEFLSRKRGPGFLQRAKFSVGAGSFTCTVRCMWSKTRQVCAGRALRHKVVTRKPSCLLTPKGAHAWHVLAKLPTWRQIVHSDKLTRCRCRVSHMRSGLDYHKRTSIPTTLGSINFEVWRTQTCV